MKDLEVGQVLSLRIRIGYFGKFREKHPYLILHIDEENNIVELGQLHSLEGKEYEAIDNKNKIIFKSMPEETVIDTDSFIQKHHKIQVEYFDGLTQFRRQTDKLSRQKLDEVIEAYDQYHLKYQIEEDHIVYMDKDELMELNE